MKFLPPPPLSQAAKQNGYLMRTPYQITVTFKQVRLTRVTLQ